MGAIVYFFYQSEKFREITAAIGLVLGAAVGVALAWVVIVYVLPYCLGWLGELFSKIISLIIKNFGNFLAKALKKIDRSNS